MGSGCKPRQTDSGRDRRSLTLRSFRLATIPKCFHEVLKGEGAEWSSSKLVVALDSRSEVIDAVLLGAHSQCQ